MKNIFNLSNRLFLVYTLTGLLMISNTIIHAASSSVRNPESAVSSVPASFTTITPSAISEISPVIKPSSTPQLQKDMNVIVQPTPTNTNKETLPPTSSADLYSAQTINREKNTTPVSTTPLPATLPSNKFKKKRTKTAFLNDDSGTTALKKIDRNKKQSSDKNKELFSFDYNEVDLVSIINQFAALTSNNIILPQGGLAIKDKVTLHIPGKMDLDQIWNILLPTILDIAGFSISKKENTYTVIKNDKAIGKEPMPLYIGTPPEKLPDTDQRIRYLYYLANIKIISSQEIIQKILSEILPTDTLFETDPLTNAILICDKANNIKNVMNIITELDQTNFHETMEIIRLKYTTAPLVAAMFNEQIYKLAQARNPYKLDARKEPRDSYFSEETKIIPDNKSNSIILLGRPQALERIKDFIHTYIDIESDSGQSILHIYKLQYLDAQSFAPTLDRIIKSQTGGGTGQSRAQQGAAGGTERFFEDVVVYSDQLEGKKNEKNSHSGGNKLIIAARYDDWLQIKKLIETLDIPQPQVLIEVLIADVTHEDTRELGSITRNPDRLPFPGDVNFQSAQFGNIIVDPTNQNPTTIKSNLLRNGGITPPIIANDAGRDALAAAGAAPAETDLVPPAPQEIGGAIENPFNNAGLVPPIGSTVISLNDCNGNTWSLGQILNNLTHSKILSHPHVIATNNEPAFVSVGEIRLLPDAASGSTGGAGLQTYKPIEAVLSVEITPRISSADLVNLNIKVNINQFVSPQDNTRITRTFNTNANVANGSILALGGLIRKTNSSTQKETPILGQIPIIGWLFKNKTAGMDETNLTVFILPTIIQPRLRPGISKYTEEYVSLAQQYAQEGELFNGLKDPVTRWFFKTDVKAENILNNFLAKDEFKLDLVSVLNQNESDAAISQHNVASNNTKNTQTADNRQEQEKHLKELLKNTENPFLSLTQNTPVAPAV